ncbi:uncharacterized protein si:dkey-19b23.7 [Chiloscyllium plagiosum]|uniref:uncharacterized protein si:dkey-19b23.7 n=1 Tax=Chiloscyllium plagiosum TaxID=36176 RepID=UPI001CB85AF1|nr:uncharacterized protein si:dkey-19b23.7 [Chiloscyllium plagiosum]XP_043539402.1 uncharacterized protein si:dkey-19b23.7 [Chiloscyllium plagiosum]
MCSSTKDQTRGGKKIQEFLADLVALGSLQGFRYFQPWLRGREELLLTVVNEDSSWRSASFPGSLVSSPDEGFGVAELPYADQSLLTSLRSQKRMSGCGHTDVGLPPASPCDREIALPELNCTLFLLACYAKYQCPYVWIRSNHERIIKATGGDWACKDSPLKLNSTRDWRQNGGQIWEIVAELVELCTWPTPSNPFTLDIQYFESLPLIERFLATGAVADFLQRIVIHGDREKLYYTKVLDELETLNRFHVQALHQMQKQKLRVVEAEADNEAAMDSSLSNGE